MLAQVLFMRPVRLIRNDTENELLGTVENGTFSGGQFILEEEPTSI